MSDAPKSHIPKAAEPAVAKKSPPTPTPTPADRRRDRFRAGVVVGVVVTIAIVLLIVQNGESAQLDWLMFHFKMPLWILIILTAVAGAIVWELVKVGWRRSRRIRAEQKQVAKKVKPTSE